MVGGLVSCGVVGAGGAGGGWECMVLLLVVAEGEEGDASSVAASWVVVAVDVSAAGADVVCSASLDALPGFGSFSST